MGRNATRAVLGSIEQVVRMLDKQLARIDKLIAEQIHSDDGLKDKDQILQSTPGVSAQTSATFLANLPELDTLNRQQAALLAGVAPWDFKSGKFSGKSIIFGGRASVRQGLYMAAMVPMKHNPPLKAFARRLSARAFFSHLRRPWSPAWQRGALALASGDSASRQGSVKNALKNA